MQQWRAGRFRRCQYDSPLWVGVAKSTFGFIWVVSLPNSMGNFHGMGCQRIQESYTGMMSNMICKPACLSASFIRKEDEQYLNKSEYTMDVSGSKEAWNQDNLSFVFLSKSLPMVHTWLILAHIITWRRLASISCYHRSATIDPGNCLPSSTQDLVIFN